MTRSGSSDLLPNVDPRNISDQMFLTALAALNVRYYIRKQRYSQFCIENNRVPNWSLFRSYFPLPDWRETIHAS